MTSLDRFAFERSRQALFELEALLGRHSIAIKRGSPLEAAGLNVLRVTEKAVDLSHDMRVVLRDLVGLTELATQLQRHEHHPLFHKLVPHLQLFAADAIALQVGESSVIDQDTNKVFELLVACWLLPLVDDIELDDPKKSSRGTNPDIVANIRGLRWGIACKVMHSTNPAQILGTVEKGVEQIEAAEVDRGAVIVSMKNLLDIDEYWKLLKPANAEAGEDPVYRVFMDDGGPFQMLRDDLTERIKLVKAQAGLDAFRRVLLRPKIVPALALWGHTLSPVLHDGLPAITSVRSLLVAPISDAPGERLGDGDRAFFNALNDSAMYVPQ